MKVLVSLVLGTALLSSLAASQSIDSAVVANSSVPSSHAVKSSNPNVTMPASMAGPNQSVSITADRSVSFKLLAGSPGKLVTVDASHAVYTAPSSIPTASAIGGCASFPNDSIYNAPITNLPVYAQSANWLSQISDSGIDAEPSFSHNFVTSATYPTFDVSFYYGGSSTGVPLLSWPDKKRENGWDSSASDGADHHSLMVVTGANPCHFYELYNDVISPADVYNCQDGSSGCAAQSGDDFIPASYDQIAGTDAAGLPQYLVLRLDEIKNNAIHHPTRFTLSRGLIQGPSGGTTNVWPATGTNGWGDANTLPFGARLRLRANYPLAGMSQYAQNILTSFKNYGLILADTGTNGAIQTDTDVWEDPNVANAIYEALGNVLFSDFQVVNASSLMLSADSLKVNPASKYFSTFGVAAITATDSQNSSLSTTVSIGLVGVGVGLRNPQVSAIITGSSYSYDFGPEAWVTGTSNQGISWSLVSGPGSVTNFGVYTLPANVDNVTEVVLSASSNADPNAKANQYILLYPVSPDGSFRTALGADITDGQNFEWWPTAGLETGILAQLDSDYPDWKSLKGNPEQAVYQSGGYTYGSDLNWRFIAPNGNYKVRFLFGQLYDGCNCTTRPSKDPVAIGVNGQIDAHWYPWGQQVNSKVATPWDYFAPAQVRDNVLSVWLSRVNPDGKSYQANPNAAAIEIIPDTSLPHIAVDTGMESWSPGGARITTKALRVTTGKTKQLYAVGWFMSNAVTWSVAGVGSIDSTGLYSAPPADGVVHTVTVTATSTVDPSKSATATLTIPAS